MIKIDTSHAVDFISRNWADKAREKAEESFELIRERKGKGSEWMGWRDMLQEPNDAILEQIDTQAQKIREACDIFIVCGIGGSFLGARAVLEVFESYFTNHHDPEIVFAGHQMGARYHEQLIDYLNEPKADGSPKEVFINVISKSGTTLETALAFRILRKWMHEKYGDDASDRIFCTTSPEGGVLNDLIKKHGYRKFIIPPDVGGRFSVLTPVGLLPIAVGGVDIRTLFYGAVGKYEELERNPDKVIDYAALRYGLYRSGKAIDVITSFEPELHGFCKWMQQLLGESEGKVGKGIFPTVASYSTDLHSIGQMVQQGTRNLMETMIGIEKPVSSLTVPENGSDNDDGLDYLTGRRLHDINYAAFSGTRQAHNDGDVPVISLFIETLNEQNIGELIYFYELFTAVYVYCLDVNPFDQPGVENYKRAMYKLLGK